MPAALDARDAWALVGLHHAVLVWDGVSPGKRRQAALNTDCTATNLAQITCAMFRIYGRVGSTVWSRPAVPLRLGLDPLSWRAQGRALLCAASKEGPAESRLDEVHQSGWTAWQQLKWHSSSG